MTTDSNAGDDRALFVADFFPQLGEYLAERHAGGYDAVAARARFVFWLGAHVDDLPERPVGAVGAGGPGPFGADGALMDYLAEAAKVPEADAAEVAELGARIAAGRRAERGLALGGEALTAAERTDLSRAAELGRQAKNRLLEAHLRLVVSIAERFDDRGVPFRDLVLEGSAGLSRAAEKFDDGKGYTFSVYATWWIRQAITRAVAARVGAPRIPDHTAEAIAGIIIVQRRLARELGREPTPEEVAAEFGTSPEEAGP
jgi:RNA polymerase primary sigma factor